jgi:hypothetical protein
MRFIPVFFLFFISQWVFSQSGVPIYQWKSHASLHNFNTVHRAGKVIYAGSDETLMQISTEGNEVRLLSKVDGLSDVGVTQINHHKELDITVIAYKSGNIDLLKGNRILNINDIKRSSTISGSKRINHIQFNGNYAYLSTDFGLVILNLVKNEIKESALNISSTGNQISIFSSTIQNDSIYIATSGGLYVSHIKSNLLDFESWFLYDASSGLPNQYLKDVCIFQGEVYALVTGYYSNAAKPVFSNVLEEGLYKKNGSNWVKLHTFNRPVTRMSSNPAYLSIGSQGVYYDYTKTSFDTLGIGGDVREIDTQNTDEKWLALNTGVFRCPNEHCYPIHISSMNFSEPFNLVNSNNQMICLYGGYAANTTSRFKAAGFDKYTNFEWINYSPIAGNFDNGLDLVDIVYNPFNDMYYVASYGNGLFLYKDGKVVQNYSDLNSPLINQIPGAPYTRVTGVDIDQSGSVWMLNVVNTQSQPSIHALSVSGEWTSYNLNLGSGDQIYLYKLSIDDKNNKWFVRRGMSGVVVFNEKQSGSKQRVLRQGAGSGNLPADNVLSIKVDKNQDVWFGTGKGIAVFRAGSDPFTEDVQIPYFDGFPLLVDKQINDIEVDGGNKKWIATNNGLWYFNEDVSEVLQNFTTENSPLPSNDIKQVEVDGTTGEVFVLTDVGIVSFRGDATDARDDKYSNVKVFPNPVRTNFDGVIAISGLISNAEVKITDVFGNLVYETTANGGTATWSGNRLNGKRAESGVYLVFSSSAEGENGNIAKIVLVE